jgi:hypothetical protein
MIRRIATGLALICLWATSASAATPVMAPINRLPSDPPRIPLTRAPPLDLPAQTPESLLKAIYARKSPWLGKVGGFRRAFMPDLARAMAQDAQPGDGHLIDFDWRYGVPPKTVRKLHMTSTVQDKYAEVTVSFRHKGKPDQILVQLFQRNTGWRIHDIGHTKGPGWSVRKCLNMPRAVISPVCEKPPTDPDALKPEPLPPALPSAASQAGKPASAPTAPPAPPPPPQPQPPKR